MPVWNPPHNNHKEIIAQLEENLKKGWTKEELKNIIIINNITSANIIECASTALMRELGFKLRTTSNTKETLDDTEATEWAELAVKKLSENIEKDTYEQFRKAIRKTLNID